MTAPTAASLAEAIPWRDRAATALLGYTPGEAIGPTLALIVPSRYWSCHADSLHAAVASGSVRHGSRPGMLADASEGFGEAAFTLELMTEADGTVSGVVASAHPSHDPKAFV